MDVMTEHRINRIAAQVLAELDRRLMTEAEFTWFRHQAEVTKLLAWASEERERLSKTHH